MQFLVVYKVDLDKKLRYGICRFSQFRLRYRRIRIRRVENDGPDSTDEILDSNFAMIDCKRVRAFPVDSDGRDH